VKQGFFSDGLADRPGLHDAVKELNDYRDKKTPVAVGVHTPANDSAVFLLTLKFITPRWCWLTTESYDVLQYAAEEGLYHNHFHLACE